MLLKIVRRKDPIELNYFFFNILIILKKLGSLVGATAFYYKQR